MDEKHQRVTNSFENADRTRCVDIVIHDHGRYGFAEWRRDPEDPGNWYRMADDGGVKFDVEADAIAAARLRIVWFGMSER